MAKNTRHPFFFRGLVRPGYEALIDATFNRRRHTLTGLLVCAFLVAVARLSYFSMNDAKATWQAWQGSETVLKPQTLSLLHPQRHRAQILDAQGQILANNIKIKILCHRPGEVKDPQQAATLLTSLIPGSDVNFLADRLKGHRHWLKYEISPRQAQQIHDAYIPGIYFCDDQRRVYPHGRLFAHPIGFTGADNQGLAGVEARMNLQIQNSTTPIQTSLDATVQAIVQEELSAQISRFEALGGVAILMRADTSELISLVSLPTFDPNKVIDVNDPSMFNRATMGVYELGSVMKPFTIAAALNEGIINVDTQIDVSQNIKIGEFEIEDFPGTPTGNLSVAEIVQHSSNIGTAHIARMLGAERQQEYLRDFGLIQPVDLEVIELSPPLLPNSWRETELMTVAFGHGISVTPLQLVAAQTALVNGGLYRRPTLLAVQGQNRSSKRVIDDLTSQLTRSMLRRVAVFGSGKNANVDGYIVGGKTGTAEKSTAGGYDDQARISSFLGAFPIHDPAYVLLVSIDGPKPQEWTFGHATGGWVAAPTFGRIVERIGPHLGIERLQEDPYGYEPANAPIANVASAPVTPPVNAISTGIKENINDEDTPPSPLSTAAQSDLIHSLILSDGIHF